VQVTLNRHEDQVPALVFLDFNQQSIRLTEERHNHLLQHPEMEGQLDRIGEVLAAPHQIVATRIDPSVHVYQRFYENTPVSSKYLLVVVKKTDVDTFILTAFYSRKPKSGDIIWSA
jgi:hypothetical protein